LSIEKKQFLQKISKNAIFITLKNVLKNFSNKKFHFDQKTSVYHLFAMFFQTHKKIQTKRSGVKQLQSSAYEKSPFRTGPNSLNASNR